MKQTKKGIIMFLCLMLLILQCPIQMQAATNEKSNNAKVSMFVRRERSIKSNKKIIEKYIKDNGIEKNSTVEENYAVLARYIENNGFLNTSGGYVISWSDEDYEFFISYDRANDEFGFGISNYRGIHVQNFVLG